jgi:hypothetical protein
MPDDRHEDPGRMRTFRATLRRIFQPLSRTPVVWRWWQLIVSFAPAFVIAALSRYAESLNGVNVLGIGLVTTIAVLCARAAYSAERELAGYATPRFVRWRNVAARLAEKARNVVKDPDHIDTDDARQVYEQVLLFLQQSLGDHGRYELTREQTPLDDPSFDLNLRNHLQAAARHLDSRADRISDAEILRDFDFGPWGE